MKKQVKSAVALALGSSILSTGLPAYAKEDGRWLKGEYHNHTTQSNDAQNTLELLLNKAFNEYDMDWLGVSDHLRLSERDTKGNPLPGGDIPMSEGIINYQVPGIKQLMQKGNYRNKIIFSGAEWDMPTYEHFGIGIVGDAKSLQKDLKALNQFEYLFTDRDPSLFHPDDVKKWEKKNDRAYKTKADARRGLQWLEKNYKQKGYAILNHPHSPKTVYTIADLRDFNNIAPNVAFGFEGMPGNQMEPDRGGYNLSTPENRTYGGADYMLAKVGGLWDALLGEGRRFWNFSNADSHFEISDNRLYSSGYFPGQYSKNYTWVEGNQPEDVIEGMRSGKSFGVYGDLINALEFNAKAERKTAEMGEELKVKKGETVQLTITFKSPEKNNNGDSVQVDHVDLISGDVTGKVKPGTPEYYDDTNDSAKVLKRFTSKDWKTDKDGYHTITYKVKAKKDQYFRLRGTNLGLNIPGETKNGEPLIDVAITTEDNETRFEQINERNYKDLWFYSNPIFVDVK